MKYNLVTEPGGFESIIHTDVHPTFYDEGGHLIYTSISGGFSTLEELKTHNKVQDNPCNVCGGIVSIHWNDPKMCEKMEKMNLCFSCNYWDDRLSKINNKNVFIVNGTWYTAHFGDTDEAGFKGHGGRRFEFERLDTKERVVSKNVWCGGDVSKYFKDKIPDNAIIIPEPIRQSHIRNM